MKAIQVKCLPPTNTKGRRLKAIADGVKPLTISASTIDNVNSQWGYSKQAEYVALQLCERMGWGADLVEGCLPNGDYVFCFADSVAM